MAYENLLVERDGAALIVTINRPSKLNALNTQTLTELGLVLDAASADDGVRALVLTGAGRKAFVAGADIEELSVQTPVTGREHARKGAGAVRSDRAARQAGHRGGQRFRAWRRMRARDGVHDATGRGHREVRPTRNQSRPHSRLCRIAAAAATGRTRPRARVAVDRQSDRRGRSVPHWPRESCGAGRAAADRSKALAQLLAGKAPVAVRYIMDAVAGGLEMSFADAQTYEATLFGLVATTDDMREGTRAFLEKRKPTFTGR
jgi:enoyl-CoA hydratase